MTSQKVAIIGAGITGLYLAWKLSARGHRVTVFEKKEKIGKEACSGLFSERILKFVPPSRSLVQNHINHVLIHFPQKTVNVRFSKRFLVMSHAGLDRMAARLARRAGAKILLRQTVRALPAGFDRIIGCDGANSFVRKKLGLKEPIYRVGLRGFVRGKNNSDYVETWPVRNGFLWKIPRGRETEYGIIAPHGEARGILAAFAKKKDIHMTGLAAALIPEGLRVGGNSRVTLVGDAAGLTKPWSGGGVIWGLIAAQKLLESFPDFSRYQKEIKRYFKLKIGILQLVTRLTYFLGFHLPWLLPQNLQIESDAIFSGLIKPSEQNR